MNAGKNVDTCFFPFQNSIYSNGNAERRKEKGGLWRAANHSKLTKKYL